MPKCVQIKRPYRKVCIGDLNSRVTIQVRAVTTDTTTEYVSENMSDSVVVWALIKTRARGVEGFDSVNLDQEASHDFYIRYRTDVDAQTWIKYDGREFDILAVENLDERKEFLKLSCNERGDSSVPVNNT